MRLNSFTVSGFRSLSDVRDIPISAPTILAGHNDGGKSAVLAALGFLVGTYKLTEEDRTYDMPSGPGEAALPDPPRCESTEVQGEFTLDEGEQATFGLPETVLIRRRAGEDLDSHLECWMPVPRDERLRDLSQYRVADLKPLAKELGLSAPSTRRGDLEQVLLAYARENSDSHGWVAAPSALYKRMPRVLSFGGKSERPDDAVRSALLGRFQTHMDDDHLRGQVQSLETVVKDRLRTDAKLLCDHIKTRCPDLTDVFVEPEVSFTHGFQGAPLRIARTSGQPVSLDRSGLGSTRRISLAIWEWTSELLTEESRECETAAQGEDEEPTQGPLHTIVIYDEPDTHLDYGHQRKIMRLIQEQSAMPRVNVMVATHSMNLIDGVDISDVVHLKLQDGRTVVERLGADGHEAIDGHLRQIAAALGLRNSVLLHERCFLAVEGDTEQRAFPLLFRLSEGLSLQSAGIALWACFNNVGALHLARYLVAHNRSVMLAIDADSRNATGGLFKQARLESFFGKDVAKYVKFLAEDRGINEFEELFTDEQWAEVANQIWPKDGEWLPNEFASKRGAGKFSSAVLEMLGVQSDRGPKGKPDMMYDFALALKEPEDVPPALREMFAELRALAD
ncbi:hypothetical protein Ssi03_19670 [Sphaerisporangium siamense]|uniref:AAA domain-containing protein n=1 Tax=Sphaerisporangium siamense TaxID=795645 RepID=A0A7W7DES3_9ACTN|nr:hypothetical protein [Sphaerisporangium siamense]MBB4705169.1 hypothetical protein [Sphaerisporangium siamense]GII83977.1 hypothetical protein Ssi03_19670 [Sphaerisporangium siamense]